MSEISSKVGEDTNVCSAYLNKLIPLDIIRKEAPHGENTPRKAVYTFQDNMCRFWYCFIPENNSIIARGDADLAYKRIEPFFADYISKVLGK